MGHDYSNTGVVEVLPQHRGPVSAPVYRRQLLVSGFLFQVLLFGNGRFIKNRIIRMGGRA